MSDVKIYQVFYLKKQKSQLDSAFIPLDNTENKTPEEHEYPLLCKLFEQNKDADYLWGMVSFRWHEKVSYTGTSFIRWITANPGYDVYVADTFPRPQYVQHNKYTNIFVQGEDCHPGMMQYFNRLSNILGYNIDLSVENIPIEYMIFAHYYVGNKRFWNSWMQFLLKCIDITKNDNELYEFAYVKTSSYRNFKNLKNFCFVVERLAPFFLYTHRSEYRIILNPTPVKNLVHVPRVLRS